MKKQIQNGGEKTETLLVFLRHAESTFNAANKIQGQSFSAMLTQEGKRQSVHAGKSLRKKYSGFEKLYSSDLPRCVETADIVCESLGIAKGDVIFDQALREISRGRFEGIDANKSSEWKKFQQELDRGYDYAPEGHNIETYSQAQQRIVPYITKLAKENKGKKILIISHGEINKVLFSTVMGHTLHEFLTQDRHAIKQPNCCINEVSYTNGKDSSFAIIKMDDVDYLL